MKRLKEHLSPALVLSVVAVFIALSGGAYAALSANSVGSKQLKKNAVTAKKIKKNAVTSAKIAGAAITTGKIKNDAVDGSKVNESTLSQVPSAASADSATSAASADSATTAASLDNYETFVNRASSSFTGPTEADARAGATKVPVFSAGPVSIYMKCFSTPTTTYGALYIETSENGVGFASDYDSEMGNPFLNTGTPEADRELLKDSVGLNNYDHSMAPDPFVWITPAGDVYRGEPGMTVKNGNVPGGNGIYGEGNNCLFINQIEKTG